jgi:hypothetical protein
LRCTGVSTVTFTVLVVHFTTGSVVLLMCMCQGCGIGMSTCLTCAHQCLCSLDPCHTSAGSMFRV